MIEVYAGYEVNQDYIASGRIDRKMITQMQDAQIRRDLVARGLTEADIISRERIIDGEPVEWVASTGEKHTNLRFCDRIVLPGDK